jgi:putative transposase
VAYLQAAFEMSERRACRVIETGRTSVRYQAWRPDDGALRDRLKALAQERRRFGYRRLHVLLRREGYAVNRKRVQRIYREERLTMRRRGGRKRAIGTRRPMETPLAANQRWSLDFVSDQMTDGRRFRILAVVDDCTRECLGLVADTSLSGLRVARELDNIVRQRGRPGTIVSDNGTELTSNAILTWADDAGLAWHYITSPPASRSRMASSKASTAACATNCSTRPCSARCRTLAPCWRRGGATTTKNGHTRNSAGWPRDYASAVFAETGRHAAQPDGSARRPLATSSQEGSDQPRLSLWLDEKSGSPHSPQSPGSPSVPASRSRTG